MKNIGIVLLGMTFFGCATSIDNCYHSTANNSYEMRDKKCLRQEINKMLALHGDILIGGEFKSKAIGTKDNQYTQNHWIGILTSPSQDECNKKVKSLQQEFPNLKVFSLQVNSKKESVRYICSVKVEGFESKFEMQKFKRNHPRSVIQLKDNKISKQKFHKSYVEHNTPHYSIEKEEKEVISNINIMCDELKINYEHFQQRTNMEQRVINKAKRDYEECIREQANLKKSYQSR